MKTYLTELTLPVSGMSCTACASSVESILKSQNGVISAEVNYSTSTVRLKFDPMAADLLQLQQALKSIGYDLVTTVQNKREVFDKLEEVRYKRLKNKLFIAIIFSMPVFFISMIWHHTSQMQQYLLLALSLPVIFYSGRDFYLTAFRLARIGKTNMDTLVALGTASAFMLSLLNTLAPQLLAGSSITGYVYYESAVVIITLILLGRFLEERSRSKSSAAIRSLMNLQPDMVIKINDGKQESISINEIMPGDSVLIKPGNTVPVDGIITKGSSWIDESMMSGEPEPVFRQPGDQVLAGTLNSKGRLEVNTLKTGASTNLSRIIAMVEEAQNSKPPVQLLVDKISSVFVPVVILISLITFVLWIFVIPDQPDSIAIVTALSVLIIACPCALGLATPTAIIAAIGNGAKKGILFRDASGIESAGKTQILLIDKTGTLTQGKPGLAKIHYTGNMDEHKTREIFAALTSLSAHPLSVAVSVELSKVVEKQPVVDHFNDVPGKGIQGSVDGITFLAGSPALLSDTDPERDIETQTLINRLTAEGFSLVMLASETGILALAALQDELRHDAAEVVKVLSKLGIETHMLTGDNLKSAELVAKAAGINHYRAGMSPADKAAYVGEMKKRGKTVCMAGDGINDTIALAKADVGMAMGSGTDASREAAAITLTGHNLMQVARAIELSRKTSRIIKENLIWAFGYNVIAIPVAAGLLFPVTGLLLNPMIASAAMAFSSVSVVLNSLRLR